VIYIAPKSHKRIKAHI